MDTVALVPICSSCGAGNRAEARFCDACGTPLAKAPSVSEPAAPSAPAAIANGRYEILRLLGEGGKKRVYLARDNLLERDVALALIKAEGLDADTRARLLREAQAMGRLGGHPHIVTVFDLGEEDGQPYLVTELMAGGDLTDAIERAPNGRLPLAYVLELGKGISRGLAVAHEQGLIHRDLKPGNVWLTTDGQPQDRRLGPRAPPRRVRASPRSGLIMGTVAYLPPEQVLHTEVTRAGRPLLARSPALRAADRPAAVSRRAAGPGDLPAHQRSARRAVLACGHLPAGARGARSAAARQGPRRAAPIRGRRARRAGGDRPRGARRAAGFRTEAGACARRPCRWGLHRTPAGAGRAEGRAREAPSRAKVGW